MSEEAKNTIKDDLAVKKEAVLEPVSEEQKAEPTQEELDWRGNFPDELKTSPSLLKFKTVEDLAKSYLEAEKKISSNIGHIDKSMPQGKIGEALNKVLGMEKEAYKVEGVSEDVKELGFSFGLKPEGLKQLTEVHTKALKAQQTEAQAKQVSEWKNTFSEGRDLDEVNKNIDAGLKDMGMTYDQYKETLGDRAFHPEMLDFVEKRGKALRAEGISKIQEGTATGGLPSGEEELLVMFDKVSIQAAEARSKGQVLDAEKLDGELNKIRAKLLKVQGARPTPSFI